MVGRRPPRRTAPVAGTPVFEETGTAGAMPRLSAAPPMPRVSCLLFFPLCAYARVCVVIGGISSRAQTQQQP